MLKIELSVVIPIFNEEGNIEPTYLELIKYIPENSEIIWVDDGSTDASYQKVINLAQSDPRIKLISFSRNFGHQPALFCGIQHAHGERTLIMDADLQHPPSLYPEMLRIINEGYDIVSGRKINDQITLKSMGSLMFYKLINFISDVKIEPDVADFRLFTSSVKEAVLSFSERKLFVRGIFSWIGFKHAFLPFEVPKRVNGSSKYNMRKMLSLAQAAIFSFCLKPLKMPLYFGMATFILTILLSIHTYMSYLSGKIGDWQILLPIMTLLSSVQFILMGIVNGYVANILLDSQSRPHYIIKRKVNCD